MLQQLHGSVDLSNEHVFEVRHDFKNRVRHIQRIVERYLTGASRDVWACDPAQYTDYQDRIVYSEQLTNFLQGHVEAEANLNSADSCKETCSFYGETRQYNNVANNLIRCNGTMRHCEDVDNKLDICLLKSSKQRKIGYIKTSGIPMGNPSNYLFDCASTEHVSPSGNSQSLVSIRHFDYFSSQMESSLSWFVKCSNCICMCDDAPNEQSDRYFSLREAVSDISQNK